MEEWMELYSSPSSFAGVERGYEDSLYVILGAPFDSTSSFRQGQRFAPSRIREASINIEGNGFYARSLWIDHEPIYDAGDLSLPPGDAVEALARIRRVISGIVRDGRVPVTIGGEHTVTLGVLQGLRDAGVKPCVIVLDAHYDLRSEYLGVEYSHATVFRRALDKGLAEMVVYAGVRAYDREEDSYARDSGLVYVIYSWEAQKLGPVNVAARIRNWTSQCTSTYLSIDIDVLDPAYAPGAANPEPGGLTFTDAARIVYEIADERLIGLDLVEVSPPHDCHDITSVTAAKLLQEAILARSARDRSRRR